MGLDKGDVLSDEEAMKNMAHLGQTIAWLGKAIAAISAHITIPQPQGKVALNGKRHLQKPPSGKPRQKKPPL